MTDSESTRSHFSPHPNPLPQGEGRVRAAIDYSAFGKICVSGNDAEQVLQNILTQDIKKIPPGEHAPAALLTHTGKILLYMEVYRFADHYILVLDNTLASKGIPLIDKFIITEDVKLEDATESYAFFQIFRPNEQQKELKPGELYPVQPGEYLLCPADQKEGFIKSNALRIVSGDTAERLRIEAGVPRYGVDIDETTILSETTLDGAAVSETKGCYPGQEVIARIKTYKKLQKKLIGQTDAKGQKTFTYLESRN